jgi:uncharacterized protein YihD (DUF1040 family)
MADDTLSDKTTAAIRRVAEDHGLEVEHVELTDEVLVLHPADRDAIPETEAIQRLADALERMGFRYVTFEVDTDEAPDT